MHRRTVQKLNRRVHAVGCDGCVLVVDAGAGLQHTAVSCFQQAQVRHPIGVQKQRRTRDVRIDDSAGLIDQRQAVVTNLPDALDGIVGVSENGSAARLVDNRNAPTSGGQRDRPATGQAHPRAHAQERVVGSRIHQNRAGIVDCAHENRGAVVWPRVSPGNRQRSVRRSIQRDGCACCDAQHSSAGSRQSSTLNRRSRQELHYTSAGRGNRTAGIVSCGANLQEGARGFEQSLVRNRVRIQKQSCACHVAVHDSRGLVDERQPVVTDLPASLDRVIDVC